MSAGREAERGRQLPSGVWVAVGRRWERDSDRERERVGWRERGRELESVGDKWEKSSFD